MGINSLNDVFDSRTPEQIREVRNKFIQSYLEKYFGKNGVYTKMRRYGVGSSGEGYGGE
jgi:hypothetical protein